MEHNAVRRFERTVEHTGIRKILKLELSVLPESWNQGLRGCGMLVVNPPYGLVEEAGPLLEWLWKLLAEAQTGAARVEWLVPE
jgi:23S rRNA (adenine2030-N6)-methyltransferase